MSVKHTSIFLKANDPDTLVKTFITSTLDLNLPTLEHVNTCLTLNSTQYLDNYMGRILIRFLFYRGWCQRSSRICKGLATSWILVSSLHS